MAIDWHKVRNNLRDDGRVIAMAAKLNQGRATIVGACSILWALADEHSRDGYLHGYTPTAVDRATGVRGFAECMASEQIGWLAFDAGGCRIVRWDEHNGKPAKQRAKEQARKRRQRSCPDPVPKLSENCPAQGGTETGPHENDTRTTREPKPSPPPPSPVGQPVADGGRSAGVVHPAERFAEIRRSQTARDEILAAYPKPSRNNGALNAISDALVRIRRGSDAAWPAGASPPDDPAAWLLGRVRAYAASQAAKREGGRYVPGAERWFGEAMYCESDDEWNRAHEQPKRETAADRVARMLEGQS